MVTTAAGSHRVGTVDLVRVLAVLKQQHRALQVAYPAMTHACDAGACPICTLIAQLTED